MQRSARCNILRMPYDVEHTRTGEAPRTALTSEASQLAHNAAQHALSRALRRTQQLRMCTAGARYRLGLSRGFRHVCCAGVCTRGAHELEQSRSSISASSAGGPAHPSRPLQQCAPARACVREREHACVSAVCVLVSLNACACATSVRDLC